MTSQSNHVRVINLSVKTGRMADIEARLEEVGARLRSIPGLQRWTAGVDRGAESVVAIAEYDTEASAVAAAPVHGRILADFEDFFASPPQIRVYEVIGALAIV